MKHNITTLHHNNLTLDKFFDIAQVFSDYFCSIALELSDRIPMSQINPTQYLKNNFQNSMLLPTISTCDAKNTLRSLKNKNSNINEISVSVLKQNCDIFSTPLTFLFNQSITTGTFLSILKKNKSHFYPEKWP